MSPLLSYARVALPVPLGQAFTYRIPEGAEVAPGARVFVQFGRRKVLGVVVDRTEAPPSDLSSDKIRPLLAIVDHRPALPMELLSFLLELARYYVAPLGEVVRLALPTLERKAADELEAVSEKKLQAVGRLVQSVRAVDRLEWPTPEVELPRGSAKEVLAWLEENGETEISVLQKRYPSARNAIKRLKSLGVVQVARTERKVDPFFAQPVTPDQAPALNPAQRAAVDAIESSVQQGLSRGFLLDGVTASGKTEVYLHASAHALSLGKSVIILVPEIALTPQLVGRFRARLGDSIAVLHSGLSEAQRLSMWRRLRDGEVKVAIGARSALFAPVENLGLVCVDEEHDGSFKQDEGVRYNARDMALLRAHRASAVCVLGSATPSLSSEAAVRAGKLERLVLPARAHSASTLPEVELIDLKQCGPGPSGDPLLSVRMHRAISDNLAAGGQTILFLNRRGFAPSLVCNGCGAVAECPHCSVALTLHKSGKERLECHYCEFFVQRPETCSKCGGNKLDLEGMGTERVEELLSASFPSARIARLDRDTGSGQKSERILDLVRQRKVDILVGTQMVTKGHDLPGVTLVGVLNADAALSLPDFRAAERTFHLLVQVAGRAGRTTEPGKVLIQTRNPDHPAIVAARTHDVRAFVEQEMQIRKDVGYPPYRRLALVRFDGLVESEVARVARRLAQFCEAQSADTSSLENVRNPVEVLGPAPAPLKRLRNRFRYRFMLRSVSRAPLRELLLSLARTPPDRRVRMSIDVDPSSML